MMFCREIQIWYKSKGLEKWRQCMWCRQQAWNDERWGYKQLNNGWLKKCRPTAGPSRL